MDNAPSESLVLVIPCFNEATRLDLSVFQAFLERHSNYQFLFVDDGSQDQTFAILTKLQDLLPNQIQLLKLEQNSGKAEAVRLGLKHAAGSSPKYVGFWDADLATPLTALDEMQALLSRMPNLHAIFGARVQLLGHKIQRKPLRHYLGRLFATVASLVVRLPVYDTQCGSKLFRASDEFYACLEPPFLSRWIFDVELIARMLREQRSGSKVFPPECYYELPLHAWKDVADSKIQTRDFFRAIIELWRIQRRYR